LDSEFVIAEDEQYDIYWKNKLVRVIEKWTLVLLV
jgi:hypothetical protein